MVRVTSTRPGRLPSFSNVGLFCFEKNKKPVGTIFFGSRIDSSFQAAKNDNFTGITNQFFVYHPHDDKLSRVFFIGLGKDDTVTVDTLRKVVAIAIKKAMALKLGHLCLRLPSIDQSARLAQAATEGAILGTYQFDHFKSKKKSNSKTFQLVLIAKDEKEKKEMNMGIKLGHISSEATNFARDLINTPPSDMTPDDLVKTAKSLVKGPIKLRILDKTKLRKMGMGGILGVNRGSAKQPYLLHLIYKPTIGRRKKIGFCGKGITFDSGGLSLKPAKAMETMKMDMAGAATVLALFKALSVLKPNIEVHGFAALTENLPGEKAVKPGDVLRARNGKTIEVLNTDAEGRLVLADALSFASEQNLDAVVDIATLTGACAVALGNSITAVMGNNQKLIEHIKQAGVLSGEKVWELPLETEYESHIKSQVADIKNLGRPMQAGTIIGGIFLKEFVKPSIPWAHLDIASTAWEEIETPLSPPGSTGSMVRSLIHAILSYN